MESNFNQERIDKESQEHINRVREIRGNIDETIAFQLKIIDKIYEQGRALEIFGCPAHIKMFGDEGIYFPAQNPMRPILN